MSPLSLPYQKSDLLKSKYFLLSFLFLSLLSATIYLKNPTPPPSGENSKPKVLGAAQRPQIFIVGTNGPTYGAGLISLASTDEPAIEIGSYDVGGMAQITLYKADKEALLKYLTHDKDNKQTQGKVNLENLQSLTSFNQNITAGYGRQSKVTLPLDKSGVWYLTFKLGDITEGSFIVRSDTGVLLKEGDNEFIFWGQNFTTKRSISEGSLKIYSLLGGIQLIGTTSFDGSGIAKIPISKETDIALAETGQDSVIVPINMRYLNSDYNYQTFTPKGTQIKYFIFTDRPLYRPGDTVYFKAVLRDDDDARYTIPQGQASVKVYRNWDEKNALWQKSIDISDGGSVYGQYTLLADAPTGDYQVKVEIPGTGQSGGYWGSGNVVNFTVQYFRKPEYSIDITSPKTELISGDTTSFKISGSYFSGQPLSGQNVSYTVYSADYYEYEYLTERYGTGVNDDYRYSYWGGKKVLEGNATLNERGEAEITLNTKLENNNGKSQVFSIEAQLNDGSGNPAFSRKNILVLAGEYGIYRKDYQYSTKVGTPYSLGLALSAYHQSLVGNITLNAKIHRENWIAFQETDKKYPSYRKEEEDLPDISAVTDGSGQTAFTITPKKVGSYLVTVTGKDTRGNSISKTFYFWASLEDQPVFTDGTNNELKLSLDKAKYSPSQNASLSIYSDIPNRDVFLSLERGRVNRFQVVTLTGNSKTIEIPIVDTDMPNIYVKASSFSDSSLDDDLISLPVSTESKKLNVVITPNQTTYGPGETVTLNIRTTDTAGNPVSGETALFAVDKALFELVDKKPDKIFDTFWRKRGDDTQQAHSLEGTTVMGGAERGGGGGNPNRTTFKDTAYWNPALRTDSSDQAQVRFDLPDNLTTWVIAAISASADTKSGQSVTEITVSKDIVIRPVLPNILRVGDKVRLSALARNYTNSDEFFDADLSFDSGDISQSTFSAILIKSKDQEQLYWDVSPTVENENAKIKLSLRTVKDKRVADSVTQTLPIIPFGFKERRAESGEGSKNFEIKLSPDTDLSKSTVSLSLSSTLVGTLPSAMKYLINYPYGCVEQTTSRLVPAIIAKSNPDLFTEIISDKNLDKNIKEGLKRLGALQHGDGGWSWWSSGNSDPFVTAYVVEYLISGKHAGITIDENVLQRGVKYLENDNYYDPVTNQYKTYALTDSIPRYYALSLAGSDKVKTLGTLGVGGLSADLTAMAVLFNIAQGDRDIGNNGLSQLLTLAKTQGDGLFWEPGSKEHFGSIEASTALAIRAILAGGGDRDSAAKAVRYLTKNRKTDYWHNTFATAQAVRALTEFAKTGAETAPDYSYNVTLDGQEILRDKVSGNSPLTKNVDINPSQIKKGGSILNISKSGTGQLYSTLTINELRTDRNAPALEHGLKIKKQYYNDKGGQYKPAVGDSVTVQIALEGLPSEDNYAVIEDELPAGLVPINLDFKNEQYGNLPDYYYYSYGITDREITRNGIIMSLYRISSGMRVYSYKARVVSEGKFTVPPATASLMYSPEIYGRSDSQTIETTRETELREQPLTKWAEAIEQFGPGNKVNIPKVIMDQTGTITESIIILILVLAALLIILRRIGVIGRRSTPKEPEDTKTSPPPESQSAT